jgi:hypothetical protein
MCLQRRLHAINLTVSRVAVTQNRQSQAPEPFRPVPSASEIWAATPSNH